MPYEDNTNSFLFGLNQFTPPTADASTPRTSNMLANLEAFASDDVGGSNLNEGMPAQAPNFADQLALWTNANFSFDGPTGHALLGDEEKEKEEAEHNRRREDENRANVDDERERTSRNAAASSRGSNALRGKARDIDQHQSDSSNAHPTSSQPTPSPAPQAHQQAPYYPGVSAFQNAARTSQPPVQASTNNHLYPPYANGFPSGLGQPQQQQGLQTAPSGGLGSLDMTSALALQHLLASNPLALASLSHLAGLNNPHLQNQLTGITNNAGGIGMFGTQQQTQNSNNSPAAAAQWLAAQSQNTSQAGSFPGPSQSAGWPVQMPPHIAAGPNVAPVMNGINNAGRVGSSGRDGKDESGKIADKNNTQSAEMTASDSDSGVAAKKKRTSTSEGKRPQIDEEDDGDDVLGRLEDIEKRYEIPPLSLIDTGNPEADAEANRQAIEEDKRRRNTAASARFRIKKKQREAALETAAKELHQRLADLESENARLRTENGWLKSLITVRPDQTTPEVPDQGAVPNLSASAGSNRSNAASASRIHIPAHSTTQPSLSVGNVSHLPDQTVPDRNNGLHPRGVGTTPIKHEDDKSANNMASGKREREK